MTTEPTNDAHIAGRRVHYGDFYGLNELTDVPLFALVSVTWATEVTTVNAHTGASHTKYVPGLLGSPMGTSWYLAMVTPGEHGFTLTGRHAAGHRTATLPDLDGINAPRQVKVHDFALHR